MKIPVKRILVQLIFIANIGCILLLLLSDMAPYLNPYQWWPVALTGILFPLLLITTLLFFLFWLFTRPRKAIYSLVAILISIPGIIVTFGSSFSSSFTPAKEKGDIRLATWNVGLMNYTAPDSAAAVHNNAVILKKLQETDADIICLQEFFTAVVPGNPYNFIEQISQRMNYPYHYFSYDIPKFEGNFYSGTIIFSRHPIIDTEKVVFPKPFAGSAIKAGIIIAGDTIDMVTTRLQSVHFERNEYKELNNIKNGADSGFAGSKNIIRKLRLGYKQRVEQVELVKTLLNKSNRPLLFSGDLNDVPVSYTYAQIKNNLKDTWVNKGTGLGRTFLFLSPTLRIDQIFYNHLFKARQVKRLFSENASDHNALVADFTVKKNK